MSSFSSSIPSYVSSAPLSPSAKSFSPRGETRSPTSVNLPKNVNTLSAEATPFVPNDAFRSVFPSPRVATYNVGSLSSDAKTKPLQDRESRVKDNLRAIARSADVIHPRNPWPHARSVSPFSGFCGVWKSQLGQAKFGGYFYPRARYLSAQFSSWSKHPQGGGTGVCPAAFAPPIVASPPLLLMNVYLPSGNSADVRARRVSCLSALRECKASPPRYCLAGGDWNLTEFESDSSGDKNHFASTPLQRKALRDCLDHFNLREIYQPTHTKFEKMGYSRLDRFYVSHQLSDMVLLSPRVSFPSCVESFSNLKPCTSSVDLERSKIVQTFTLQDSGLAGNPP